MTEFNPEAFIAAAEWTTARSQDHQYTVRWENDQAQFQQMIDFIEANGYRQWFAGRPYVYFEPGDGRRYWHIHPVINRTRVQTEDEQLGLEGDDDDG
jgi:hypothetical protein